MITVGTVSEFTQWRRWMPTGREPDGRHHNEFPADQVRGVPAT